MTPRLLTEAEARAYTAGVDPRRVCEPLRVGRKLTWDRLAIDRALDALSGLKTDTARAGPLAAWERSRLKAEEDRH